MKAVVCRQYGPPQVYQIEQVERPVPAENDILVKVCASSVTASGSFARTGKPLFTRLFIGLSKPKIKIHGTDLAGEVIETGKQVTKFSPGDRVFAITDTDFGAWAEYCRLAEDDVVLGMPSTMDFHQATAMLEGPMTALPFLRDEGDIQQGHKLLIIGASGAVGSSAVQLGKYYGAEVTAVCSASNTQLVESLGADHVIDYTREDFTRKGGRYDIVFDAIGKYSYPACKILLSERGRYLSTNLTMSNLWHMLLTSKSNGKKSRFAATGLRSADDKLRDLQFLKGLIEQQRIKAVIDRVYPIEQIVDACEYVDQGHKKGNVILTFPEDDDQQTKRL